jgi:Uncharacterised protein family (UPF0259)
MYEKPVAPRPVGGVIDDAIRLYRESFRRCAPIGVLGAIVSTAFYLMVVELAHREGLPLTSLEALVRVYQEPPVMALNLLQIVLLLALFGAMIVTQNAVSNGEPGPSVAHAIAVGFARLGRCVLAAVISTLLILAGCILIVPGIYLSGILSLWPIAMYVDDAGAIQSLDASRKLIRGNWWHASTVLAVAMLIWLALSMFAGFVANSVQLVAGGDAAGQTIEELISAAANVILLPIIPAGMIALANDLKQRQRAARAIR